MELQSGFNQFLDTLKREGKSPSTLKNYEQDLRLFHSFLTKSLNRVPTIKDLTERGIQKYLNYNQMERHLQANTCQRQYYTISSFCSFAYQQRLVDRNEALNVERIRVEKEEPVTITTAEFNQLEAKIKQPIVRQVLFFLYHTGLRISECLQLNLEDIDFEKKMVHVHHGKGGKYRAVPLVSCVVKRLRSYVENERPRDMRSNRLFATKRSGALSDVYVNRQLQKAIKELGWSKKVTAHTLRHSFASNLVKKGVHHVYIQKLLGHQSLASTGIYTHVEEEEVEETFQALYEQKGDIHERVS